MVFLKQYLLADLSKSGGEAICFNLEVELIIKAQ